MLVIYHSSKAREIEEGVAQRIIEG